MMFSTTHSVWSWSAVARRGALLLAVVLLAGCPSSQEPATGSVSGKVTLDDAPLAAGTVLFVSDDGQAVSAELQQDGTYTLQCRLGQFKVAVTPPAPKSEAEAIDGPASDSPGVAIPPKYQDLGTSGLTTEVKEGSSTFDISLTSK